MFIIANVKEVLTKKMNCIPRVAGCSSFRGGSGPTLTITCER